MGGGIHLISAHCVVQIYGAVLFRSNENSREYQALVKREVTSFSVLCGEVNNVLCGEVNNVHEYISVSIVSGVVSC